MSKEDLTPGALPEAIPDVEMHAPIEIAVMVHVKVPQGDLRQSGKFTLMLDAGRFPTQAELKEVVNEVIAVGIKEGTLPDGARLMTKAEFVEHVVQRESGDKTFRFPKGHNPNFVDPTADTPAPAIITNPNLH